MTKEKDTPPTPEKELELLDMSQLEAASEKLQFEELVLNGIGRVRVGYVDGVARDAFDLYCSKKTDAKGKISDPRGIKKELVALSLVNADGTLMYAGDKKKLVSKLKGFIIDAVFDKSREINKIGEKALATAKKK